MVEEIIAKYYADNEALRNVLLTHSRSVAEMAVALAQRHPEYHLDETFVWEAAMLHDVGIFLTDAPRIFCRGKEPYIRHGYLGAELLRSEGMPRHARVAERHTGTGLTEQSIRAQSLPLPLQDFCPETLEEQLICYADKFYSKTRLDYVKTFDEALASLRKFGDDALAPMFVWRDMFGVS